MITEIVFVSTARSDLNRLDRQVAQRVVRAVRRYAETGQGNIVRLRGSEDEFRLRVGDWRVRFIDFSTTRAAEPPGEGEVQVRIIEIQRVLPRGRAYRD